MPSPSPPGRQRILTALESQLHKKGFHDITTAEIAREAGVTEGLIYKYFKDKQDLLFEVLFIGFEQVIKTINSDLTDIVGTRAQLEVFIRSSIRAYSDNRVFSKIILLEVRNSPGFYQCKAYQLVKAYSNILNDILTVGMENGVIASVVTRASVRNMIFGAVEHACLTGVVFNRDIHVERLTTDLCQILFKGIFTDPRHI